MQVFKGNVYDFDIPNIYSADAGAEAGAEAGAKAGVEAGAEAGAEEDSLSE